MFADSLLENHWNNHGRRGWDDVGFVCIANSGNRDPVDASALIYTEGLPKLHLVSMSAPLPPPGPPPAVQQHSGARPVESNMFHGIVVAPPTIPVGVKPIIDDSAPSEACTICVPGGIGLISNPNPIPGSLGMTGAFVPPPPPKPVARPPRISHMMEGNLIYRVQPVYPPLARAARIQGVVHLRALISRNGTIENLQAIDGHPMLIQAAIDAVRQWR